MIVKTDGWFAARVAEMDEVMRERIFWFDETWSQVLLLGVRLRGDR